MKRSKTNTGWVLFLALFLFLLGIYMMLFARGIFPVAFWFTVVISLIGLGLLILVYTKHMKSKYVFFSMLLLLSGILGTIAASFGLPIRKFWPIFMIVFGISLFVAGWYKTRKAVSNFLVISILFVCLGGFFCIFSFGYSSMRLRTFLFYWWPAIFFVGGVVLLALYLVGRSQDGSNKQ